MEAVGVVILFVVLAIIFRVVAGGMDSDRVGSYIREQGGVLLDKRWAPFGKGWVGEKDARIYRVRYRDRDGHIHEATVKTSMWSGVYFTEDRIVSRSSRFPENQTANGVEISNDLELENERLRRRIADLEERP